MGPARLELARVGRVERLDPREARRAAELRDPDVGEGRVGRGGKVAVVHGDQRALAVDDAGAGDGGGVVEDHERDVVPDGVELRRQPREVVDLVVGAHGVPGEVGVQDTPHFHAARVGDGREGGFWELHEHTGVGEVPRAAPVGGEGEEVHDVAVETGQFFDGAVERERDQFSIRVQQRDAVLVQHRDAHWRVG